MLNKDLFKKLESTREIKTDIVRFEKFESLDFPSFARLKIKDSSFKKYKEFKNIEFKNLEQKGILTKPLSSFDYKALLLDKKYGVSPKHRELSELFYNVSNYIEVEKEAIVKEPVFINMSLDKDNDVLLDKTTLVVGESASITLAVHYSGESGESNSNINIFAADNANVNVIVLQTYGDDARHYYNGFSSIGRDAKVFFTRIDIGAKDLITDYSSYIDGIAGESRVESIYFGDKDTKIDMAYNTYHNAIATQSEISVNGALKDKASKVFRGDLYFAKDARKSEGREEEFAILLDDTVKAHSIPALLCDEDDVIGEHAASAGQIDENKLFYLMTRGLSEQDAKRTIVLASYEKALSFIPNDEVRADIKEIITQKMDFS